jgi:hypothetical protein
VNSEGPANKCLYDEIDNDGRFHHRVIFMVTRGQMKTLEHWANESKTTLSEMLRTRLFGGGAR